MPLILFLFLTLFPFVVPHSASRPSWWSSLLTFQAALHGLLRPCMALGIAGQLHWWLDLFPASFVQSVIWRPEKSATKTHPKEKYIILRFWKNNDTLCIYLVKNKITNRTKTLTSCCLISSLMATGFVLCPRAAISRLICIIHVM